MFQEKLKFLKSCRFEFLNCYGPHNISLDIKNGIVLTIDTDTEYFNDLNIFEYVTRNDKKFHRVEFYNRECYYCPRGAKFIINYDNIDSDLVCHDCSRSLRLIDGDDYDFEILCFNDKKILKVNLDEFANDDYNYLSSYDGCELFRIYVEQILLTIEDHVFIHKTINVNSLHNNGGKCINRIGKGFYNELYKVGDNEYCKPCFDNIVTVLNFYILKLWLVEKIFENMDIAKKIFMNIYDMLTKLWRRNS